MLKDNSDIIDFKKEYYNEKIISNTYIDTIKQIYENPYFDNFLDTQITKDDKDNELIVETLLDSHSSIDELLVDSKFLSELKIKLGRIKEDKFKLKKKLKKIHDFVVFALEYHHEDDEGKTELENLIHLYEIGNFKQLLRRIA